MANNPNSSSKKRAAKKKKKNSVQKSGGRLFFQVDGDESTFQTTDIEPKSKQSSNIVFQVGSESEAPLSRKPSGGNKKQSALFSSVVQDNSEPEEFDDLDVEYPDIEDDYMQKEKPLSISHIINVKPKTTTLTSDYTVTPKKTTQIQSEKNVGKKPPPKKAKSFPKKKSGGSMKSQLYNARDDSPREISSLASGESITPDNPNYLRSVFDTISNPSEISFHDFDQIDKIYDVIVNAIIHLRNNPFYMFAVEVATSTGRKSEYYIQSGLQQIFRILTIDGKQNQMTNNYRKQIQLYSSNIKLINKTLKPFFNGNLYDHKDMSQKTADDLDTTLSDYQKKLAQNMKIISDIQKEIMVTNRLLKHSHMFFTMKFFYSPELQALVNNAMYHIESLRDEEGNQVSLRKYDPQKIIKTKPSERTSLANLCGLLHNLKFMELGQHPGTTRFSLEHIRNSISEETIRLNDKLSTYDDILEDSYTEPPPNLNFLFPFVESLESSFSPDITPFSPPLLESLIPLSPSQPFSSQSSSGKKRSTLSQSKRRSDEYYVPKRYRI